MTGHATIRWTERMSRCRIIPALAWVVLPTLAVRGHFAPVLGEVGHLWATPIIGDTRSWWKAAFICGIALWMLFHLAMRLLSGWRPCRRVFAILLGLPAIATGLSAFLSLFPQTAWLGYTNLYEGAAVLFSYLVAAWYVSEMMDTDSLRLLLVRVIGGVGFLNGCHGVAEGFGWHFWQSDLGLWILGVSDRSTVQYRFSGVRMAYGTVFQPNHYGMLMAMLGSLALGMIFSEKARNWRIFWLATFIVSAAGVFFSNSRAGVFTFLVVAVAFLGVKCILLMRNRELLQTVRGRISGKIILGVLLCGLLLSLLFGSASMRTALERLAQRSRSLSFPMAKNPEIQSVGLQDNRIHIRLADRTLLLERRSPGNWLVRQEGPSGRRGVALQFHPRDDKWREARIPGITDGTLSYRNEGNIKLAAPDTAMEFYATGARLWAIDPAKKMAYGSLRLSPYPISGHEGLLSGRGFIWSRLWSVIREHPLFGSGPGTFALAFPNQDLLDKQRFSFGMDTDKGHGVWAMFLVQLGVVGFLLYCVPVAYAFFRTCFHGGFLRTPVVMAMSAYAICSLSNDSTVGVTPIFCALVGLGVTDAFVGKDDARGKKHAPSP